MDEVTWEKKAAAEGCRLKQRYLVGADGVKRLLVEGEQVPLLGDDVDDVVHVANQLVHEHRLLQTSLVGGDRVLGS